MMKLTTLCINLYCKSRYTHVLWKSILLPKHHTVRLVPLKYCPVLTLCSTRFVGFHTTSLTNAKSHQERENEYAHGVMENIQTYKDSLVKLHSADKKFLHSSSSSKELSEFAEMSSDKGDQSESDCKHLIFTYGTLKKGEPNHDLVTDSDGQATFVGVAKTVHKWPLIIASRYNIPYLLYNKGVGKNVIGEVYEVDSTMLNHMDELECHPKYYTRLKEEVEVIRDSSNKELSTPIIERPWIYFLKDFRKHLLDLPHLEEYTSSGSHGLEYVSSEKTSDPEDVYS